MCLFVLVHVRLLLPQRPYGKFVARQMLPQSRRTSVPLPPQSLAVSAVVHIWSLIFSDLLFLSFNVFFSDFFIASCLVCVSCLFSMRCVCSLCIGGPAPVAAPAAVWPVRRSPNTAPKSAANAFPQSYAHSSAHLNKGGAASSSRAVFSSPPLQRPAAASAFPSPADSRKSSQNAASKKNAASQSGGGKKGKKSKKSKKSKVLFSNATSRRV